MNATRSTPSIYARFLPAALVRLEDLFRLTGVGADALILFRGFPPELFTALPSGYARFDASVTAELAAGDLPALAGRGRDLAARLFTARGSGRLVADYAALLSVRPFLADPTAAFGAPVVVVENDLFPGRYPFRTAGVAAAACRAIAAEAAGERFESEEPEVVEAVSRFVGDVVGGEDGLFRVSWLDLDAGGRPLPRFRFFAELAAPGAAPDLADTCLAAEAADALFPDTDGRLARVLLALHEGDTLPDALRIAVASRALSDAGTAQALSALALAFHAAGVSVRLVRHASVDHPAPRSGLLEVLRRHWGASAEFRPLDLYEDPDRSVERILVSQGSIAERVVREVEAAVSGAPFHDLFLTAPTGAGKSALFQIPAIHLGERRDLVTFVVTPLKALMHDQVESLRERGFHGAAYVNSDVSCEERERIAADVREGRVSLLYLSPEWILSGDPDVFLGRRRLGLVVVDEAHCVVTWGRDFRADYWYLGARLRFLRRGGRRFFAVLALTATAVYGGNDDMVFDAIDCLEMHDPLVLVGAVRRDNISFSIKRPRVIGNHDEEKMRITTGRLVERAASGERTIAYFPWRRQIEEAAGRLVRAGVSEPGTVTGADDAALRRASIERFREGTTPLMLATKAFGMGIDIPDVVCVYHHAPSGSLADYIQEIGRVARDRAVRGVAEIDFHPRDLKYTRMLGGFSALRQYQVAFVLRKLRDLQREKGKRNLLVSADDFAYLFDMRRDDVENKVKSALLMIEKDMVRRFGYPAVLVRPGYLFSRVFACVERAKEARLAESPFAPFFTRIVETAENVRREGAVTVSDLGDIFEIDLKGLWERHFPKLGFPELKRRFFRQELFGTIPVLPRQRLDVRIRRLVSETRRNFEEMLEGIGETLGALRGVFFERREFERALAERIGDRVKALRTAHYLFNHHTQRRADVPVAGFDLDAFLQVRLAEDGERYHARLQAFAGFRARALRVLEDFLACVKAGRYVRHVHLRGDVVHPHLAMARMLEAFDLATYSVAGGRTPELFVRVNDPARIDALCRGDYENLVLADLERRRRKSERTLERFFMLEAGDAERWDLIERYFLGLDLFTGDGGEEGAGGSAAVRPAPRKVRERRRGGPGAERTAGKTGKVGIVTRRKSAIEAGRSS